MPAKLNRGIAQAKAGEVVDGEEFMAQILSELDELERKN